MCENIQYFPNLQLKFIKGKFQPILYRNQMNEKFQILWRGGGGKHERMEG